MVNPESRQAVRLFVWQRQDRPVIVKKAPLALELTRLLSGADLCTQAVPIIVIVRKRNIIRERALEYCVIHAFLALINGGRIEMRSLILRVTSHLVWLV